MARYDCDVCGGSGSIALPLRQKLAAFASGAGDIAPIRNTSRTYACPECGPSVDQQRIALLYTSQSVAAHETQMGDGRFRTAMLRDAAHAFVDLLLAGGYIKQSEGPLDKDRRQFEIRSELGVVSLSVVATLKARIAERQGEVAALVADEAVRLIDQWGSHYGHATLRKDEAARFVREALKTVTSKTSI
jgi:hypothetical protein